MIPLVFATTGEEQIIKKIGGNDEVKRHLENLGFIESETAYSELFGADGWENPYREEKPDAYLAAFKKYLAEKNMSVAWQNVMEELNKILDWSQTRRPNWDLKVNHSVKIDIDDIYEENKNVFHRKNYCASYYDLHHE